MKKTKIYRVGAALMATLMVLTCMPQTSLYAVAEESPAEGEMPEDTGEEIELEQPEQTAAPTGLTAEPAAEATELSAAPASEGTETASDANPADTPAPAPVPVETITLAPEKLSIQRLDSADIKFTLAPATANVDTDKVVTFSSADPTVATVAPTTMTAMSGSVSVVANKVGTTTITATTGNGKTASCVVEVTPIPVEKVIIEPVALNLDMNPDEKGVTKSSGTLSVVVLPENADNQNVILRPNYDDKVIEVDDKDLNTTKKIKVTAKKGGWTTLSVVSQDNNKIYGSCEVTVEGKVEPLTGLSAKPDYPTNLYEGSSVNLKPYVVFNPTNATDKELTWSVSSTGGSDYAEVNEYGRVTAKWKAGETAKKQEVTITAAAKNDTSKKVDFKIDIKRNNVPLKALYVTPAELTLEDAGSKNSRTISVTLDPLTSTEREITATVSGEDGKTAVLINAGRSYDAEEAKATATAEADGNGRVYFTVTANELEGLKKQDTCTITFVKKGADATAAATIKVRCNVTVNKYVTPVDDLLLNEELPIVDGEEASLTATIKPLTAEDRNIVWTVDDPEIVSIEGVDADGKIEATKKDAAADGLTATVTVKANMVGTCKITATAAGDVTKTCIVTVTENATNPATGLTITSAGVPDGETTEITLKKGQTYSLIPNVTPETAANKKVKWTAGSLSGVITSAVASVDKSGVVTANALGDCVITAQASGSAAECTKTVQVHVVSPHMEVTYPENWSYVPEDQPIEEETLRRELQVSFCPIEKPIPEQDKWVLASGEPHDYELKILGEDGKTKKLYTKEDMETPGVKVLLVCFTYDGVTYEKSVPVEMKEFDEADLISVTQLSGDEAEVWNVPNGTPASALPLAKTTEIVVGRKIIADGKEELKTSRLQAEIEWRVSESGYNSANSEAQDFTVIGSVKLPDYVTNTNNVSLRVQALVHVREQAAGGKKTARPTFSVLGGEPIGNQTTVTLPYGSKIVLESATDEAEIYYMVDRRPDEDRGVPKDAEHRYKSPIEITARTTTIYAVAAKHGFIDSDCSECTIKLVQAEVVDPEDPDAPLPDDVTDEDREQIGGKVPDGLWAVVQTGADEKDGFAYTGKAIKPSVHVYDRTVLLTEKKDYTVTYSNNVNAGSAKGSAKPPTVTVTGKGNYEGKALVHFTIKPQSIEDDAVLMDESVAVAYNKKAQKPKPTLTWNGKKLSKNKDYTYADVSYTDAGIYNITVTGTGNYTGTRTMKYEIYDSGVAISKLTFSKIANQKYTGDEIRPQVTVKNKKVTLTPGTEKGNTGNYWIKYENCTNVGNASVVIVGKGNYKGSKRINFKILPVAKIKQAGITLDVPAAGVPFTGKPYTPKCTVNYAGTELKENKDYKISYQNNTNAGKATVVITGMGPYTGTVKKTFKILQNDISGLAAAMGTSFAYEKGGCKPKPEVTFNGMKLSEGTDYTLSYKNNNKIGNTASVTVKGKGNYKGQIVRYFEVTIQDISKLKVVAADKAYQEKKNIYKTKVRVIDLNGKALDAGTDYAKDIYYTYESGAKAGQPILSTDIIPVGTVIGVDVRVATPRRYQGTVHGTYRIVQADISKAKVTINPQEYTGRSIRPKKSQIQVTLNGVQLRNDDYEIVGYENNVKQGNAKITIRGVGGYGGTKTATFKIKKKGILNLKF